MNAFIEITVYELRMTVKFLCPVHWVVFHYVDRKAFPEITLAQLIARAYSAHAPCTKNLLLTPEQKQAIKFGFEMCAKGKTLEEALQKALDYVPHVS